MAELTKIVLTIDLDPSYLARLRMTYPQIDVVVCTDRERLTEALPGAQMVLGRVTPEQLRQSPDLRWLYTTGAGVDAYLFPELIESDVLLTNNSGVHAPHMAEYLVGMMLAFARGLPFLMRAQMRHEWSKRRAFPVYELGRQTLAVIGLGDIGQALAWRAKALGMQVTGTRRHVGDPPPGVDRLASPEALHELLAEADHVAITLPLTDETRGLFGATEFRLMKPTAFIYNIGRGPIIQSDALITALRNGEIAGAGLDVTDPEPLPSDSPLWDMENVLITSHTSGGGPYYWERGIELLLENIRRYIHDEPMLNVVDKRAGY